jgi:hypothetical protein
VRRRGTMLDPVRYPRTRLRGLWCDCGPSWTR